MSRQGSRSSVAEGMRAGDGVGSVRDERALGTAARGLCHRWRNAWGLTFRSGVDRRAVVLQAQTAAKNDAARGPERLAGCAGCRTERAKYAAARRECDVPKSVARGRFEAAS